MSEVGATTGDRRLPVACGSTGWETASVSDRSQADEVVSGVPYLVTSVNDRPPASLDDFVGDPVVALTVASDTQVVIIHGASRHDRDSVIVYEKDGCGTGKDVRTWRIQIKDGRFEASERSIY